MAWRACGYGSEAIMIWIECECRRGKSDEGHQKKTPVGDLGNMEKVWVGTACTPVGSCLEVIE